ncbi:MAG: hypothetical protein IJ894_03905 [Bacteroidales bacterium]|nr:hypothetical protein [Bacteroidales bacterium]
MIATSLKLEPSVPFIDFKTSIVEKIWKLDSLNLLSTISDLLSKNAKQEPELKPYTMDEINQMIDESLDDIKNGRVYTSEQVDKMMKEEFPWLK